MKNNRINLRLLCALSSILLVSNGLQAMGEVEENVEKLLKKINSCQDCNLKGADLNTKNLKWANLQGADLKWANLQGANLQGANLKGANLQGAYLQRANLKGANFTRANLQGAKFNQAKLEKANLKGATGMTDKDIINSGAILDKNTTLPSGKKYSK